MSRILFLVLLFVQLIQPLDTLILTDENFDTLVNKTNNVFVVFHSPTCHRCIELLPHIDRISQQLSNDSKYIMGKVDVSQEFKITTRYKISRFPTLIFFVTGEKIFYNGTNKYNSIIEFIENILGPKTKFLETEADIKKEEEQNSVIAIYPGKEIDSRYNLFTKLITLFPDIKFFNADPQAVKNRIKQEGKLIILKNFDEKINIFNEEFTFPNIKEFVNKFYLPKIFSYNIEVSKLIFGAGRKSFMVFRDFSNPNQNYLNTYLEELSEFYRGKILFVNCDVNENSNIFKYLKIQKDNLPQIEIVHSEKTLKRKKFISTNTEKIVITELYQFINKDLNEDKIAAEKASQSTQFSEQNPGSIVEIDDDSFTQLVLDNKKDAVIAFYYQRNDDDSIYFMEIFKKIASSLKSHPNIIFGKFKHSLGTKFSSLFTEDTNIILFRGDKKNISNITFQGNYLDGKEIINFLKTNCYHSLPNTKIEEL